MPRFDSLLGRPPHSPSGATSPRPRPGAGPAAGADGVSQLQLARAALRALRRCRPSRRLWQPAPFYGLLRAADPHVRWAGAECVALLAGLVRLRRSWAPLGPAALRGAQRYAACHVSCAGSEGERAVTAAAIGMHAVACLSAAKRSRARVLQLLCVECLHSFYSAASHCRSSARALACARSSAASLRSAQNIHTANCLLG